LLKHTVYGILSCCDRYKNSNDGWDEEHKIAEMYAKEARYLIARSRSDPNQLFGFLLLQMVQEETMDDDVLADVAYW
jgi:hypothetical protein